MAHVFSYLSKEDHGKYVPGPKSQKKKSRGIKRKQWWDEHCARKDAARGFNKIYWLKPVLSNKQR